MAIKTPSYQATPLGSLRFVVAYPIHGAWLSAGSNGELILIFIAWVKLWVV